MTATLSRPQCVKQVQEVYLSHEVLPLCPCSIHLLRLCPFLEAFTLIQIYFYLPLTSIPATERLLVLLTLKQLECGANITQ